MKTILSILLITLSAISSYAQFRAPSLSPKAITTQTIGYTEISIDYSRPSIKGRTIFSEDGLLPFGEMWRTGANAATKISFSETVTIQNQKFNKGDYSIISIPNKDSWEIRWYVHSETNWTKYIDKTPYITTKHKVIKSNHPVETLYIGITNISLDQAFLTLEWETTKINILLNVELKDKVLAQIEKTMSGPSINDYYQAALYLHSSKTDLNRALAYIQKVTSTDKALFFQVTREALILSDLGRKKEAKSVAKTALLLSKKAKNTDFIRINKNIIELN